MSELAKAHAEIERLNHIVNSGDTLRDHAIRKAIQERDDALTRLAEAEKRIANLRTLGPHLRTAAIVDDWQTFDELLRELEADSASDVKP